MKNDNFQLQLFAHLKEVIPAHLSMVDELCDLLNLSPDSVYRRIRGEKELSINELKEICIHYQLSLDHLLDLNKDSVLFKAPGMNGISGEFVDYLKDMLKQLKYFNSFEKKEMDYLLSRSTLISQSAEKERNRFFNTLRQKINTLRD